MTTKNKGSPDARTWRAAHICPRFPALESRSRFKIPGICFPGPTPDIYPTKPRRKTTSNLDIHDAEQSVVGLSSERDKMAAQSFGIFAAEPCKNCRSQRHAVRHLSVKKIETSNRHKHQVWLVKASSESKPWSGFFTWEGPTQPTGPDFHGDGQGTRHDTSETPRWSKEFLASKGCVFVWFKIEESDV